MHASRLVVLASLLAVPVVARAEEPKPVQVELGSSRHLRLGQGISRLSVGTSEVADIAAFPPDQLLITGKRVGQTTATVWFRNDDVVIYTVRVEYPVTQMTDAINKAVAGAKGLKVQGAGRTLVLTGEVPTAADAKAAEDMVRGISAAATGGEPPQVVNLLQLPGDHQVQIEVSFSEVSRTALKEIGLNFWYRNKNNNMGGALLNPNSGAAGIVPDLEPGTTTDTLQNAAGLPIINTPLSGAFGAVFATATGSKFPFTAALSVLSNRGYARTLSEPTLVALSGHEASFLAGGEFPLPIPQALNQIGVEYKKFGIQLKFTPTVVGDTIQLKMAATVSDIDFGLGLRLASVTVPGLTERHSETTIRLRDGQSFAIAGLLSDKVRSSVDKVPGLGDLPLLGALFRSTSYRREETELLVVVTARLVRPQGEKPLMPGEGTTTDPSDLELFLLGSIESRNTSGELTRRRGKPAGQVGFER
jgi:pilus assembly protein CpaC